MELTSNHNTYNLANLAHIIDTDVNAIEGELKARIDPKTEIIFDESVDEPLPVIAVKEE